MDRESSDEEDDRENLIVQNDTRTKSPRRSTFHIDDFTNRVSGNLGSTINKGYLLAIFLPLFILILYFTTDIKSFFQSSVSNFKSDASGVRESELRTLYLLRQQHLGLLKLWDNTQSNSTLLNPLNTTSNYSNLNAPVSPFTEDLKSALLKQISLNNQIQQLLFSSHQWGNFKDSEDNYTDPSVGGGADLDRCRKTDQRFSERRTIEWKPKSDKYLLAICVSGQMSNHLICLEKHMFFAAVLNRVLVIPSSKVDYEFSGVIDIDHINKCVGRKVVVTFKEFAESKKNHLSIDKIMCYFSLPQPCFIDNDHVKKLKSLGISMNKLESAWVEDVKKPTRRTIQDVIAKFSSDADVIAVGDVFFADVEKDWVMQPGGPIDHKCKTLIEPSRVIVLTAQRFVQTFLGESFIALHFRRHGFLKFCNAKKPSCFYPIPQAAECINRVVERANTPVIYLSTDAAESETGLLQSLTVLNGKSVPLVKRPGRNSAEKWDALLYRQGIEDDPQVEAMLDKTICGMSKVFIGASGSTFTEDILRLRRGWGSASICDEYLCEGELPNFIAEDE